LAFGTLDFGFLGFGFMDFGILDFGVLDSVFWAVTGVSTAFSYIKKKKKTEKLWKRPLLSNLKTVGSKIFEPIVSKFGRVFMNDSKRPKITSRL